MQAMIRLFSGAVADAEQPATQALDLYHRLGNPQGEAWATQHLAWIAFMLGRIEEGERRIEASVRMFEAVGDRTGMMWSLGLEANLLFHNGFAEAAAEVAEVVLEEARLSDNAWAEGMMVSVLAQVDLWRGATDVALTGAERAVELLGPLGDPFGLTQARMLLGRALVMAGRVQAGLAELDRATRENGDKLTNQFVTKAVVDSLIGDLSAGAARQLLGDPPAVRNIGSLEVVTAAALALICDGADEEARSELLVFSVAESGTDAGAALGGDRGLAPWRRDLDLLRSGQHRRRMARGEAAWDGGGDRGLMLEVDPTERLDGGEGADTWDDVRRVSAQMERPPSWSLHLSNLSPTTGADPATADAAVEPGTPFPRTSHCWRWRVRRTPTMSAPMTALTPGLAPARTRVSARGPAVERVMSRRRPIRPMARANRQRPVGCCRSLLLPPRVTRRSGPLPRWQRRSAISPSGPRCWNAWSWHPNVPPTMTGRWRCCRSLWPQPAPIGQPTRSWRSRALVLRLGPPATDWPVRLWPWARPKSPPRWVTIGPRTGCARPRLPGRIWRSNPRGGVGSGVGCCLNR